jgi:hypothetical protein
MNGAAEKKVKRQPQEAKSSAQGSTAATALAAYCSQASRPKPVPGKQPRATLALVGGLLGAVFVWSCWPTLVNTWNHVQDYSHGYLVAPLAVLFLWARRDRMPSAAVGLAWPGLLLVVISGGMRVAGAWYYFESLDGWSILLWTAGVIWLFLGRAIFWWSLPSVAFL